MQNIDFCYIIYVQGFYIYYTLMKKALWILSLSVLLFSTFAPFLTYASEAENEAKQILIDTLDETMSEFNENIEEIEDSSEKNKTIYQLIGY